MFKPEDKLEIGDILLLSNNVNIPSFWKKNKCTKIYKWTKIDKWTKIEIVNIKKWKNKEKTTMINYKILWWKEDILTMSKFVFITYFCDDIKIEKKHRDNKIKELKRLIEEGRKFKKNIEKSKSECATKEVKGKIHFIISLTKTIKKKLWY